MQERGWILEFPLKQPSKSHWHWSPLAYAVRCGSIYWQWRISDVLAAQGRDGLKIRVSRQVDRDAQMSRGSCLLTSDLCYLFIYVCTCVCKIIR
jgi:hypothetical protein